MALSVDILALWITLTSGPIHVTKMNFFRLDSSSPVSRLEWYKQRLGEEIENKNSSSLTQCNRMLVHCLWIPFWICRSRCRDRNKQCEIHQIWILPCQHKINFGENPLTFDTQLPSPAHHCVSVEFDRTSSYASRTIGLSMDVAWGICKLETKKYEKLIIELLEIDLCTAMHARHLSPTHINQCLHVERNRETKLIKMCARIRVWIRDSTTKMFYFHFKSHSQHSSAHRHRRRL